MKITAIRLDRMRLPLDPPFCAAWDPVSRRHFDATRSPQDRAQVALAAKSAGFLAAKIRIDRTGPGASLEALRATRAAVGDEFVLMADLNQWWRMAGLRPNGPRSSPKEPPCRSSRS